MSDVIPPGGTIGILGGGQLGRMTALAAARLGYRCRVFEPEAQPPAGDVAAGCVTARWDDAGALAAFARSVDVITLEFENVPVAAVAQLAALKPVRPGARVLAVTQDRVTEKRFVNDCGIATTDWRPVDSPAELAAAQQALGGCILKTTRMGYDGKGQTRVARDEDPAAAWGRLRTDHAIAEAIVDFACEVSAITARGLDGTIATFPLARNEHEHHILRRTVAPAPVESVVADEARRIGHRLVEALDLVGLLAVEMFLTRDGRLLVNELAPRPHNSGHWTMDGCATSQFEQLVRAVCGLPLGDTTAFATTEMVNLLGAEAEGWPAILAEPGARLHLYGKRETRPGRKMGHVNRLLELRR